MHSMHASTKYHLCISFSLHAARATTVAAGAALLLVLQFVIMTCFNHSVSHRTVGFLYRIAVTGGIRDAGTALYFLL